MASGGFRMLRCGTVGVEAVEAETRHAFPRHMHEQFGIGLIHRGAQKSHSGRGMVEAGPGDTITVNPGEVHDGMPIGDHGRSWRMLYLDPRLVAETARDIGEGRTDAFEFSQPVINQPHIGRHFRRLYAAMTMPGEAIGREEALLMLLAILKPGRNESIARLSPPAAIARARSMIDDDPARAVTLSDLAGESGLSRFQVLRGFARACGLTPHAYIVQRRINVARRLIGCGLPLAEAAVAAGFSDQSHMTRIFRRTFGIAPGAYADAVA